jgi:hypothetical protein
MKTQKLTLLLSLLILSIHCSGQNETDSEKKKALESFTICKQISDDWLTKLDSTNFSHLSTIEAPQVEKNRVSEYIDEVRKVYGKIKDRKFIGSHIWSDNILLTYIPEIGNEQLEHYNMVKSKDGFYVIQPKYFGLESYNQMFSGFPDGEYVLLMFKVFPTYKDYAEEMLILWHNPNGNWQVAGYKIADDI